MKWFKKDFLNYFSLVVIFLIGAWFRFQGILTMFGGADEIQLTKAGMMYTPRTLFRINPYGVHPPFYYYLLFIANHLYFLIMKILGVYQRPYEIYVEYIINPLKFLVINRLVNFFLGSFLVILVYFLTLLIYKNKKTALIAALLCVVNPLLFNYSRQNLLEIPVTFFALLVIYFSYKIIETKKTINYLLAGLFLGIVLTTKITGAIVAPAIFLAHLLIKSKKNLKQRFLEKNLYLSYLTTLLIFFLLQPYLIRDLFYVILFQGFNLRSFVDKLSFLEIIKYQSEIIRYGWIGLSLKKIPFVWIFPPILRNEPYLGYLYLLSMIYALIRFKKEDLILLVSVLISLFWFGRIITMGEDIHYLLPCFPMIIILAARSIGELEKRIKIQGRKILTWILVVFLIYPNLRNILSTVKEVNKIDTRFLASDWIKKNIPSGRKFCLSPYSPFLFDPEDMTFAVRGKDELVKKRLKDKTKNLKWHKITEFARKKESPYWPKEFSKDKIDAYSKSSYLRIVFSFYYPDFTEFKKENIDYLILSSYDYYGYLGENYYPKDNPLYYSFLRSKIAYKSIINDKTENYKLIKEFSPKGNITGPNLLIYQIKKEI